MKKVLVVDDCANNVKLMQTLITSAGHEVLVAYDGKKGLEKAKDEAPHLIFMDIQMPIMGGVEAMKKIKEIINIPIIAFTAFAMEGDRERFLSEGFDDFLSKPATLSSITGMTEKHLAH